MSDAVADIMRSALSDRVSELKQLTVDKLNELPEYSDTAVPTGKKSVTLATWVKRNEGDNIQVVVQAYYRRFLGFGIMMAEGFLCSLSGDIMPLPEDIRLEYC